jgi:hypothetical protein
MYNWRQILSWKADPEPPHKFKVRMKEGVLEGSRTWTGKNGNFTVEPGTIGYVISGNHTGSYSVIWKGYPLFTELHPGFSDMSWSVLANNVERID